MRTLPLDYCRCTGDGGDWICHERDSCRRYLAAKGGSNGERVPYTTVLRASMDVPCNYKIEES